MPFFKTVAIYFVLCNNITSGPLFAVIKCLPVVCLIVFVVMHYRTRLAPKKMGDLRKLQLLHFEASPLTRNVDGPGGNVEQAATSNGSNSSVHEPPQSNAVDNRATLRCAESRYARLILIGLVLSLAGDICLVWSAQLFLCGMLLFALAHCAYAAAFSFTPLNPFGFVFVLCMGLAYHWSMQVHFTGVFAVAAPCYSVVIATMWWRALSRLKLGAEFWEWTSIASCFGASLFAVSDALLGMARFAGGFEYVETLIMFTYYAAQFGIAVSVIDTQCDSASVPSEKKRE